MRSNALSGKSDIHLCSNLNGLEASRSAGPWYPVPASPFCFWGGRPLSLLGHLPTHFCALSARLSTALTVIPLMRGTFMAASFANVRTYLAHRLSKFTATCHIAGG